MEFQPSYQPRVCSLLCPEALGVSGNPHSEHVGAADPCCSQAQASALGFGAQEGRSWGVARTGFWWGVGLPGQSPPPPHRPSLLGGSPEEEEEKLTS